MLRPFAGSFEEWVRSTPEMARLAPQPPQTAAPARRRPAQRPRQAQPRRLFAPRKGPKKPPSPLPESTEQAIARLEARLHQIERERETASASQDLEAITRLGQEHTLVEAELDRKLEAWVGETPT